MPAAKISPEDKRSSFFVNRRFRRQGLTLRLLLAAIDYARSQGAQIIEGYPVDPGSRLYTYMGSPGTFRQAGFRDVTPEGQARQVMRYNTRVESSSPVKE